MEEVTREKKIEGLKHWINVNLEHRIKGNKFLTEEQIAGLTERLTALLGEVETRPEEEVIEIGNAALLEMNAMIDERRISNLPTKEQFLEVMHGPDDENNLERLGFITNHVNDMMDLKKYDMLLDYIHGVDLSKVENRGALISLSISCNPINPLMRPIPKKEDIQEYVVKCNGLLNEWKEQYMALGTEEGENWAKSIRIKNIANYEDDMKFYDACYIGGAPRAK